MMRQEEATARYDQPDQDEREPVPGASDSDRPAWLAERRTGVTATEIRDLYLKKITNRALRDRKLGRTPEVGDLSHVPIIGWGKDREVEIARIAEQRYGVRPESRVFHAPDEPRFLASPDGVGEDFDGNRTISELKTAGPDIAPESEAFVAKGYYAQMVWGMRVMGAVKCLYGWEERIQGLNGFEPGALEFVWIEWDAKAQKLAAELEVLARKFLAALDKAAAEDWSEPEIDEEIDTMAVNVLTGREYESDGKALKEPAWQGLMAYLAARPAFTQESTLARVTWTPAEDTTSTVPDVEAAKAADPALFAEVQALSQRWNEHAARFTKEVTVAGKPRLTVTSVKTKENGS